MTFKPSSSPDKLKKLMTRQRLQSGFTFALGGLLLFQMVQFYQFRERLKFIDALYERDTQVISDLNKGKDYLSSFGADLNEIRQFLLLPTKSYDFSSMDEDVDLASEEDLGTQLFDFVNTLGTYQKNQQLYETNTAAVKADLGNAIWAENGLSLVNGEGRSEDDGVSYDFKDASGEVLLSVKVGYDGLFSVPLYYRELKLGDRGSWPAVFSEIQEFLKSDLATLQDQVKKVNAQRSVLAKLLESAEVKAALKEKEMTLSPEQQNEERYYYDLRSSQLAALGTFSLSKKDASMQFLVDDPVDSGFDAVDLDGSASEELLSALREEVDARTSLQKQVDERRVELEAVLKDEGFVSTLQQLGLHVGTTVETAESIEYPLMDANGAVLRVFVLDKKTAEVKVMKPGEEPQTLSSATEQLLALSKKKTLDLPESFGSYSDLVDNGDQDTILLMGKNGSNVDTMIFVNVDLNRQKITLLSVPRDLYYHDKKINAVYAQEGILAQVAAVEDVVGYKVHHYALIDMYVFKDVIDLLGGVDVTLTEDLIDPTYKVCEGEVCSTLYYPAGTYHLDGTAALRIARSRHTSSDYSRAERQQLILDALKEKALSLGFGDAPTLLSLANTILGGLETDFSVTDVLRDYFRYQHFEVDSGNVLSTGNVLENLPVPVEYVTSHPLEDGKYAIDALQPKDGDWDAIKWYARELFQ